jgi:glycosyltransferase involved in cell wall biosynthesis
LREAFASGRPVIATKVGDIPEIVQHRENGLLIEPGDTHALAAAIMEFISDPQLAARCAANGLRYATENFSFDKMMEAKLHADFAVVAKNARRESVPLGSRDVTPVQKN